MRRDGVQFLLPLMACLLGGMAPAHAGVEEVTIRLEEARCFA
jgi:hypothetical protein